METSQTLNNGTKYDFETSTECVDVRMDHPSSSLYELKLYYSAQVAELIIL